MALDVPQGYEVLNDTRLRVWLAGLPDIASRLGGKTSDWRIDEVGDGNLNLVFLVRGPNGGVCVKQSLPYVRAAGESWPMPLERAWYEHQHAMVAGPWLTGLVPAVWHYDPLRFASVVELLTPHRVLRQELVKGSRYPLVAQAVAEFIARSAIYTSPLSQPLETYAQHVALFSGNLALTRVTAELVFADPFEALPRNRWTTPYLDNTVRELRDDVALRAAVAELGHRFLTRKEALLHGDLHTGSVMVTDSDTRVIDAEFAIYGPVGFDAGVFVANLLMAWCALPGHGSASQVSDADWLLAQIALFWQHFSVRYDELWVSHANGDAWPHRLFADPPAAHAFAVGRGHRLTEIWHDLLGFAGAEIIRRIIGFAHNWDFESISDPALRAQCEQIALQLARELLLHPHQFVSPADVAHCAQSLLSTPNGIVEKVA